MSVVAVVGNPRRGSRTHGAALAAAEALARGGAVEVVDLAVLAERVLVPGDAGAARAAEQVLAADVLVVASPTYKGTYTGLLKGFLDRIGTGALASTPALPLMVGAGAAHALAVDVYLAPLLLELGARVPARGLYVLEAELDEVRSRAATWSEVAGIR
jgi:FMN reductase